MNSDSLSADRKIINQVIDLNAPPSRVWQALTTPEFMKKWMMPDIDLQIITDWTIGSPMIIRGSMNGKNFENRGTVLQFEPEKTLRYTHLSSISSLPDQPENYSIIEFQVQPIEDRTTLTLTLSNFPTESIQQHLTFYWNVTLAVFKRMVEEQGQK